MPVAVFHIAPPFRKGKWAEVDLSSLVSALSRGQLAAWCRSYRALRPDTVTLPTLQLTIADQRRGKLEPKISEMDAECNGPTVKVNRRGDLEL